MNDRRLNNRNRYTSAKEMAWDLQHPDKVGVVVFGLLLWVAHHS